MEQFRTSAIFQQNNSFNFREKLRMMNNQEIIKRFVECTIPISHCNLKYSYCYIIQEKRRDVDMPQFQYSPRYRQGFQQKTLGRYYASVNLCGVNEAIYVIILTLYCSLFLRSKLTPPSEYKIKLPR